MTPSDPEMMIPAVVSVVVRPAVVGNPAVTGSASSLQGDPVRRPETPEERHARRVAWGKEWGAISRQVAAQRRLGGR